MFCKYCGNQIKDDALFCPKCGKRVNEQAAGQSATPTQTTATSGTGYAQTPQNVASSAQAQATAAYNAGYAQAAQENAASSQVSPKSRKTAALLAFFLGGLGVHRFYVGKTGTGILQILLTCCFGLGCIWALIDFIMIVCGNFKDKDGKVLSSW